MEQPNILIFMTDQQSAASVLPESPYKAITPALDEFRKEAVSFRRTYCPSPHCCPARATFFTGLAPSQHGVWHNVSVANAISRGLKSHVRPWSLDLAAAGYRMLFAGKWHVSNFQQPRDYGWEHIFPRSMCHGENLTPEEQEAHARAREVSHLRKETEDSSSRSRRPGEIRREGWPSYIHYGGMGDPFLRRYFANEEEDNPFGDRTVTEAALEAFENLQGKEPWCMYVGTLGPHDPYIPPRRFLELYQEAEYPLPPSFDDPMEDKPALYRRTRDRFSQLTRREHQDAITHYLAFCSYEDWLFGRLVERLKELGEYDNTLILYVSDHGDYLADHGLWCKGLPSFLSAYHVPAVLKMPGEGRSQECDEFVSLADFGPTFLDAAGVTRPDDFAGISLLPLVRGGNPDWRDALIFQSNGNETYGIQRSVLTRKWRFVYNGFDYDELYDLETDPGQLKNLLAANRTGDEHRAVVRDMYRRIWEFGLAHEESMVNDYIMTALADVGPGTALRGENLPKIG